MHMVDRVRFPSSHLVGKPKVRHLQYIYILVPK